MKYFIRELDGIRDGIRKNYWFLFLDFDGTLTPIVDHPRNVRLDAGMRRALKELTSLKNIAVAIISGRGLKDIKKLVGVKGIIYAGNHGLEISGAGMDFKVPEAVRAAKTVKELSKKLKRAFRSFGGVFVEDKGLSLSVHYRMVPAKRVKEVDGIFKSITDGYRQKRAIKITAGKKVWEVRPPVKWNKGTATLRLLERKKKRLKTRVTPFYIGDDVTDEDAFRALKAGAVTIKVGAGGSRTKAKYYLKDTKEVKRVFEELIRLRKKGRRYV